MDYEFLRKYQLKINIIGVVGKKHSGKSTIAKYLVENFNYFEYNFGDKVKRIAKILFNFKNEQLNSHSLKEQSDNFWGITPRTTFQQIGTQFGQFDIPNELFPCLKNNDGKLNGKNDKCFWVISMLQEINELVVKTEKTKTFNIVIGDMRFEHEYEYINNLMVEYPDIFQFKCFKIVRNTEKIVDEHISENDLNNISDEVYPFIIIYNNGQLEDLFSLVLANI
jgi:hypothetical protein